MVSRENLFVVDFIAGAGKSCYTKGQTHGSAPTIITRDGKEPADTLCIDLSPL
jgi:hypothetical protein